MARPTTRSAPDLRSGRLPIPEPVPRHPRLPTPPPPPSPQERDRLHRRGQAWLAPKRGTGLFNGDRLGWLRLGVGIGGIDAGGRSREFGGRLQDKQASRFSKMPVESHALPGARTKKATLVTQGGFEHSNQNYLRRRQSSAAAPRVPRAIVVGSGITGPPEATRLNDCMLPRPPVIGRGGSPGTGIV